MTPDTTARRTEVFRQSLNRVLDAKALTDLDRWVDFSVKVVQVGLLVIAFIVAIPLLTHLVIPTTVVTSLIALFLTLIFEVGYKYSIIRKALDIRIQMVTFSLFALLFGVFVGFAFLILVYVPAECQLLMATVHAIVWIIGNVYTWRWVTGFVAGRIQTTIIEQFQPFGRIVKAMSMRFIYKAKRAASTLVVLGIIITVITMKPDFGIALEDWILLVVVAVVGVFILWDFFRFDTFVASLDLIWEYGIDNLTLDLMSFCIELCELFREKGISGHEVFFNRKPCLNETDLRVHFVPDQVVCPFYLLPVNYDPVLVLALASSNPDLGRVQQILGESWTQGCGAPSSTRVMLNTGAINLGLFPPFYIPPGCRVILDESILLRTDVAWVSGNPCFGIMLKSGELEKVADRVGRVT